MAETSRREFLKSSLFAFAASLLPFKPGAAEAKERYLAELESYTQAHHQHPAGMPDLNGLRLVTTVPQEAVFNLDRAAMRFGRTGGLIAHDVKIRIDFGDTNVYENREGERSYLGGMSRRRAYMTVEQLVAPFGAFRDLTRQCVLADVNPGVEVPAKLPLSIRTDAEFNKNYELVNAGTWFRFEDAVLTSFSSEYHTNPERMLAYSDEVLATEPIPDSERVSMLMQATFLLSGEPEITRVEPPAGMHVRKAKHA